MRTMPDGAARRILVTGMSGAGKSLAEVEPLLRATCTHEIDAARPVEDVVAELVALGTK
jgi:hypothetical protein